MRILLIEDDATTAYKICKALKPYNYTIDILNNKQALSKHIYSEVFDLLLLHFSHKNKSGVHVLKELRKQGNNLPVLVLTDTNFVQDRIEALNNGADDCITSLPDWTELSARIQAIQRRARTGRSHPNIIYQNIILNPNALTVTCLGKSIPISRREFALLQKLLENVGRVVSKETLMQCMYGWTKSVDSNTLEVHTHNLRKKLTMLLIKTIRGVGYLIECEQEI